MRVLVIDDNEEIREVLGFYCQENKIECTLASTGVEGLKIIRNDNFDLILLDIAMPEFSGLDVLNSLKKDGILESKNVVVISASSDKAMFEEIQRSGVKEIFRKPCSLEQLSELINRYR